MPGSKPRGRTNKAKSVPKKRTTVKKRRNTCSGGNCYKYTSKNSRCGNRCYGGRCCSNSSCSSSCSSDYSSYDSDTYSSDEPCCGKSGGCRR